MWISSSRRGLLTTWSSCNGSRSTTRTTHLLTMSMIQLHDGRDLKQETSRWVEMTHIIIYINNKHNQNSISDNQQVSDSHSWMGMTPALRHKTKKRSSSSMQNVSCIKKNMDEKHRKRDSQLDTCLLLKAARHKLLFSVSLIHLHVAFRRQWPFMPICRKYSKNSINETVYRWDSQRIKQSR